VRRILNRDGKKRLSNAIMRGTSGPLSVRCLLDKWLGRLDRMKHTDRCEGTFILSPLHSRQLILSPLHSRQLIFFDHECPVATNES
jgi:hypothetical protein